MPRQLTNHNAELLSQVLAGKPAEDIHELWPVEMVLRQSTGPGPH